METIKQKVTNIVDSYLGCVPDQKECQTWSQMQLKMIDEIMDLFDADKQINDWIYTAYRTNKRYMLIVEDANDGDEEKFTNYPVYCIDFEDLHTKYHKYHDMNGQIVREVIEIYKDGTFERNVELENIY